ncbi:nucleotidyltransferase [Methylorubrum extorquens]|uniref:nucleotidyltransferase domain-containing protein n=1 Tax=Methylorubrum extorquens TaxID=408 RepID=UPI000972898D|nr:nucleotidyltransferase domain-containing protein [Methylorubrum extorquens]APX84713.1 nucleotidyltransferase [Methylorubrum extorquens]
MCDPEPSTDACRSPFADDATERGACAFLRRIGGHYPTREVFLFGSRARGTHQADSDADQAVVLDGDHAERSRISGEMAEIAFDILRETGLLVQAVPLWESEWRHPERFPDPTLIASIRRDGVRL